MPTKRTFRNFRPGDLSGLERALNEMSAAGWQPVKPGRLIQTYRQEPGAYVHRFGYCAHRPGSADEITWLAAQERAGWEPAVREKGWILFRKPAEAAAPDDTLAGHRETVETLFKAKIARLDSLRRILLLLGTLILLAGYFTSLLPVMYASGLPLLGVAWATYRIKYLEEGPHK
jgi:hypothetical protein